MAPAKLIASCILNMLGHVHSYLWAFLLESCLSPLKIGGVYVVYLVTLFTAVFLSHEIQ